MAALRYIGIVACCLTAASIFAQEDQAPPVIKKIYAPLDTIYMFEVFDSGPRDSGLQSIDLQIEDDHHYIVTIEPPVIPCSRDTHVVTIVSKRPIMGLHWTSVFTDCAGNTSKDGGIVDFHEDFPPMILSRTRLSDSTRSMDVRDPLSGISDITFTGLDTSRFTVSITPPLWLCSPDAHKIIIADRGGPVRACVKVRIVDCQGNFKLDSICFDPKVGVNTPEAINTFEIISYGGDDIRCQLELSAQHVVRIIVVDMLGRTLSEVEAGVFAQGLHQVTLPINNLPEGGYSVIAEWGGKQYTKKLTVIK